LTPAPRLIYSSEKKANTQEPPCATWLHESVVEREAWRFAIGSQIEDFGAAFAAMLRTVHGQGAMRFALFLFLGPT